MPVTTRASSRRQIANESALVQQDDKNAQSPHSKQYATSANLTHFQSSDIALDSAVIEKSFWPCCRCSCAEGVFPDPSDACSECGHTMDDHGMDRNSPWNPNCDYLCRRKETVAEILRRTEEHGMLVIRAPPMVGKSSTLKLTGHQVVTERFDLEPVYVYWETRDKRKGSSWEDFLSEKSKQWRRINSDIRGRTNPNARLIYLIDEAQGSYEEEGLWSLLKTYHNTQTQPLYVLVCVYGAIGVSHSRDPEIESQALRMHALHHVHLRTLLFRQEEIRDIIMQFATYHKYSLGHDVVDYIQAATNGHPGMIGLLLAHIKNLDNTEITIPRTLEPGFFHKVLVECEYNFVDIISKWGRGFWSPYCEGRIKSTLENPRYTQYSHLRMSDIKQALRAAAKEPEGLFRVHRDFDAYAFCHKWGLLHTEQRIPDDGKTIFLFASPLHRRIAFRRLFGGREPNAVLGGLGLQQMCINAIGRFSPGALHDRAHPLRSTGQWGIPTAAFQDELYSCLSLELQHLPILSQYSHTFDGRIDFYVSNKKWGIEILQCRTHAEIAEHIARFSPEGTYARWDIINDFVVLNFCSKASFSRIKCRDTIPDQPRFFHVVIDPDESSAEVYTYDKKLYQAWPLSEGRRRLSGNSQAEETMTEGEESLDPAELRRQLEAEKEKTKAMSELLTNKEKQRLQRQMERARERTRQAMEQESGDEQMKVSSRGKRRKVADKPFG